ncbi:MAG: response regulator transcription factor [Roseburia sp.]|nr:response regulator transcription factor [Roseburia sp.]MCM1278625.1 response regulator transcription factor [Robinsoniella sp.]
MNRILIFDKDKELVEFIGFYLAGEGYEVWKAYSEKEALRIIGREGIQLLITDMESEAQVSLAFIEKVREKYDLPIIILSEQGDEQHKVAGLSAGADDYLVKPCSILELVARIKAQLRRYIQLACVGKKEDATFRVGELCIDDDMKKVTVEGNEVRLTPIEYKILKLLVEKHGKVLSINQIYESIWHMRAVGVDNTVAVHIRHIREKIERNPKNPQYLQVVWGAGYKVG